MAVSTPASVVVTPAAQLGTLPMSADALITTLDNTNFLYLHHIPPLACFSPITRIDNGSRSYTVPIQPSLDGLRYAFISDWLPAFNGSLTITWKTATTWGGGFTTRATQAGIACSTGVWATNTQTGIIPADARLLRVEMTGIGGNIYPTGFTAHPSPDSAAVPFVAPYGETRSGFRVFDDGLLTLAGAPINTECLDRTLHNTRSVVRDRQQAVFSFVQDDGTARNPRFIAPPASTISSGLVALLGRVQCFIPHNGETWIDVRSLGTVSAGSSTDRISVTSSHAAGGYDDTALLDASTTFDTARLRVVGPNPIIEVYGIATTGNTVSPFAVVGLWRPGDVA